MNNTYIFVDFETLENRVRKDFYVYKDTEPTMFKVSENHIFDEDLSVKKNREMAIAHNEKVKEQARYRMKNKDNLRKQFYTDCISCLIGTYGWAFHPEIAEKIVNFVWNKDCDSDREILYEIDELADFVADIRDTKKL